MAKTSRKSGYFQGGYEFNFKDSIPDRFYCKICTQVLRDPHLMTCCGKKFCNLCLQMSFEECNSEKCPHCRNRKGEYPLHVPEKELRGEIESLKICCTNHSQGCKWDGELRMLEKHLEQDDGCEYHELECPNKCESGKGAIMVICRKDLKNHLACHCELRLVQCQYCDYIGTVKSSSQHHLICHNYPMDCPNQCGERGIPRHHVDQHRLECSREPVSCPNSNCNETGLLRSTVQIHRASCGEEPVQCPNGCDEPGILRKTLDSHRHLCHREPVPCPNLCYQSGITRQNISSHRQVCPLEYVKCDNSGYGCVENVRRKDLPLHLQKNCLLRLVGCLYCSFRHFATKVFDHEKVCEMYPVDCPNSCDGEKIVRKLIDDHRRECSLEKVECKYANVGCIAKVERRHVEKHEHEEEKLHLDLMSAAFQQAFEKNLHLQELVDQGKSKVYEYRQKLVDKDLQFQKTQAKLEQTTAEFDSASKTYDELQKQSDVVRKEIEVYKVQNLKQDLVTYSRIVNSRTRDETYMTVKLRPPSAVYLNTIEKADCSSSCRAHKLRSLLIMKSIEAQLCQSPRFLSIERLYLRMTEFSKHSVKSHTWASPTFLLEEVLEMRLHVRMQNQKTINVSVSVTEELERRTDRSSLAGKKLIVELVEAREFITPQILDDVSERSPDRVHMEIDAEKVFREKRCHLKVLLYSVEHWDDRFVMCDSLLWAVSTNKTTTCAL